jgi:DNA-binding response OmpR family regulator
MSHKKILVVEDDADVRFGYRLLLEAHHYRTYFAVDAIEALSVALEQKPDLMVLDLGLPVGNGFFALDAFRADSRLSSIPVVVVSARDPYENRVRALQAGARAYVQKPWDDEELLRVLAELLAESEPSSYSPG